MSPLLEQKPVTFMGRRSSGDGHSEGRERRQFRDSHSRLNPDAQELAEAIDQYKLLHRRRFITYEEPYNVMVSLGDHKKSLARCDTKMREPDRSEGVIGLISLGHLISTARSTDAA